MDHDRECRDVIVYRYAFSQPLITHAAVLSSDPQRLSFEYPFQTRFSRSAPVLGLRWRRTGGMRSAML
jgi:hypothetical protein